MLPQLWMMLSLCARVDPKELDVAGVVVRRELETERALLGERHTNAGLRIACQHRHGVGLGLRIVLDQFRSGSDGAAR